MKEGRQETGSRRLTRHISCECVHCFGFRWLKTTILGKFWLLGGSCTGSLLPIKVKFSFLKQTGRLHLHAKFHLKVFTVSASSGQKPQFWANFEFWGLLYWLPFTDKCQIWCPEEDRTSTLTCQISSESVHYVGFQWPKTTILGKFWLLGAPVPTPYYRWRSNLVC